MSLPHTAPLRVERLAVAVYRAPIERQVRNAFGAMMANRPAVIVRAEGGGIAGYGEIWCNFPPGGAAHRQLHAPAFPHLTDDVKERRSWVTALLVVEHLRLLPSVSADNLWLRFRARQPVCQERLAHQQQDTRE